MATARQALDNLKKMIAEVEAKVASVQDNLSKIKSSRPEAVPGPIPEYIKPAPSQPTPTITQKKGIGAIGLLALAALMFSQQD